MVIFHNVPSEALVKNFFYLVENLCSILKIFKFFLFLTIPWFTKSVTSWWILVHETGLIFEYIFWNTTHQVTNLGQLIDISKGNNFQEFFEQFGWLGLSSRFLFSLATCSNYSISNYVMISIIHFFGKMNMGQFKIVNVNY